MGVLTQLFRRIDDGDAAAREELCQLVYEDLCGIARRARSALSGDSMLTIDVVHEFVGHLLSGCRLGKMRNRRYFFAVAADQMRRLLIDHWRKKHAIKRGGDRQQLSTDWLDEFAESRADKCGGDLAALDSALAALRQIRPRQFDVVNLKFFLGMTNAQAAEALDMSPDTVKREWKIARVRLRSMLKEP